MLLQIVGEQMTSSQIPIRVSSEFNKLSQSRLNKSVTSIEENLANYEQKLQELEVAIIGSNLPAEHKQPVVGYYAGYPVLIGELLEDGSILYDPGVLDANGDPIQVWCWQNYVVNPDFYKDDWGERY